MEPAPPERLLMNFSNLCDDRRGIRNAALNWCPVDAINLWINRAILAALTGIGNKKSGYQELFVGVLGTFIRGIRNGHGLYHLDLRTQLRLLQPSNFFYLDI